MGAGVSVLLTLLISLALAVWQVQRSANKGGAHHATYGWCLAAVFAAGMVTSALWSIGPMVLGRGALLALLVVPIFAASSLLYSVILGTTRAHGMWIASISSATVLVVSGPLILLLSHQHIPAVRTFLEALPAKTVNVVEKAAAAVCACEKEQSCLQKQHALLTQRMNAIMTQQERFPLADEEKMAAAAKQAARCAEAPPVTPTQDVAQATPRAAPSSVIAQLVPKDPVTPPSAVGQFRTTALAEGARYLNQQVRVTQQSGQKYTGILTAMTPDALIVQQWRYGGTLTVTVPRAAVREFQVYVSEGH